MSELQDIIDRCERIVFLGGAGVSTESGIPDFRSASGMYTTAGGPRAPEYMLSRECFEDETEEFFDFYRSNLLHPQAQPNPAHYKLAELERAGKLTAVVTQNIDGLHQLAGSHTVCELHGSVLRNTCTGCGHTYGLDFMMGSTGIPHCPECGEVVRPDVVLYGEMLDQNVMRASVEAITGADCLIVGGTSLVVYPAAGLVDFFSGADLVLLNRDVTPYDRQATHIEREPIGQVLGAIHVGV